MPKRWISVSYSGSLSRFAFTSILLSRAMVPNYIHHQHCWRAPSSGKPHEDLLCVGLQIMDVWAGVWWYPRVVCISISPLMRDGDLFFPPLLIALCIEGFRECLFRTFSLLSLGLLVLSCCWVVSVVELVILKPWPDSALGSRSSALGWCMEGGKMRYFSEQLCSSLWVF